MTNDPIILLEITVMDYAGPMGKFFVKKQLNDYGKSLNDLSNEEQRELAKKIVGAAIYNETLKDECLKKIIKILNGT
jgi:hypothetical protein